MNPRARQHFDQANQILDNVYESIEKVQQQNQDNITDKEKKRLLDNLYLTLRVAEIHLQASAVAQQSDT